MDGLYYFSLISMACITLGCKFFFIILFERNFLKSLCWEENCKLWHNFLKKIMVGFYHSQISSTFITTDLKFTFIILRCSIWMVSVYIMCVPSCKANYKLQTYSYYVCQLVLATPCITCKLFEEDFHLLS